MVPWARSARARSAPARREAAAYGDASLLLEDHFSYKSSALRAHGVIKRARFARRLLSASALRAQATPSHSVRAIVLCYRNSERGF